MSAHYYSLIQYRGNRMKTREELMKSSLFNVQVDEAFFDDLICYFDNPLKAEAKAFEKYDIKTLVAYLKVCHRDYIDKQLPAIWRNVQEVIRLAPNQEKFERQSSIIFQTFTRELEKHFKFEEKHLFPYALGLVEKNTMLCNAYSSKKFIQEHPAHTIDAQKVLTFLEMFQSELPANLPFSVLVKQVTELKKDMDLHEMLEDHVLIPKIQELERPRD